MQPNREHKKYENPFYFDTLASTEELEKSGFTHKQAVAQTKVISKALSRVSDNYTTKQDLELLEERLKYVLEIKLLETRNSIIKMMFGAIFSSTTITIAVLGFLITYLK